MALPAYAGDKIQSWKCRGEVARVDVDQLVRTPGRVVVVARLVRDASLRRSICR